jgi:hypothetical protein
MLLNPNLTANFSALAFDLYGKDKAYLCLDLKPMKLLEHLEIVFNPYFAFHLRDLYLRFNLLTPDPSSGLVKRENHMVFWHVNNQFLHPYLLFLFSTGSSLTPEVLLPYILSLEGSQ